MIPLQRPSITDSVQRAAAPLAGATASTATPPPGAAGRWNLGGLGGFALNDYAAELSRDIDPGVAHDPAGAIAGAARALEERGYLGA